MNIIIAGCGKVGQALIEKLCRETVYDITIIDKNRLTVESLVNRYDIMGVCGNCVSMDTLLNAGAENADILIAVTGSDEINLLTCMVARKTTECSTIARIRKPEYANEVNLFKEDLGLAMIINPESIVANEIARVVRFPSAIQIDTFAKGRIEILKFLVTEDSVLNNLKIADISTQLKCDILVCGVERGEKTFIPGGDFIIQAGDKVSIVSSIANGAFFFKKIGIKTNRAKDVIIVGGGATAYYLANQLLQTGIRVKIIEKDSARCDELCELLPKADIIKADGTDSHVLIEEGIEHAGAFVSLTSIDEENILMSLYARSKNAGKIITKINRVSYDEVISNLDLDTNIYPKTITAEYVVRFVRAKSNSIGSNIETMHFILDGKAEALEFKVKGKSRILDAKLESLKIKKNTLVACIYRNGKIIIPRGKDSISDGDTVIVVTTNTGYNDINDILE